MKSFLWFALCLIFISCASTSPNQNALTPEEQAFGEVYEDFDAVLILDDAKEYRVKDGDTLSSIAKDFYGVDNGYYFPIIMLASSKTILDPDLIQPGMTLTVPDLQKNLNEPAVHSNLKLFFTEIADVYKNKRSPTAEKTHSELLKIAEQL